MPLVYLDNAATSWPKPPSVPEAMRLAFESAGGNPGRAAHTLANQAARVVFETRERIAQLFGAPDPTGVVFGPNVTWALNLSLNGLLRAGDHVVTSSIEHNSVMRPLRELERRGVEVSVAQCSPDGALEPSRVRDLLRPRTRLVVITHASNVLGSVLPVADIAAIAHRSNALVLVDTAQSAGLVPIDMTADGIDLLAFTGHKSLCGPMGTGGLVIGPSVNPSDIDPLIRGGTGSQSESEDQPSFAPDRFESGTPNVPGLAGLCAALRWLEDQGGVAAMQRREMKLTRILLESLNGIEAISVLGPGATQPRTGTVSVRVKGISVSECAFLLENEFGVLTRAGLHCCPAAHRTAGSFPEGTLRLSIGPYNTVQDIEQAVDALRSVARKAQRG